MISTHEVEARDLEVGMVLLHGDGISSSEVTRVIKHATHVAALLNGISPHVFRNVHEVLRVVDNPR